MVYCHFSDCHLTKLEFNNYLEVITYPTYFSTLKRITVYKQ